MSKEFAIVKMQSVLGDCLRVAGEIKCKIVAADSYWGVRRADELGYLLDMSNWLTIVIDNISDLDEDKVQQYLESMCATTTQSLIDVLETSINNDKLLDRRVVYFKLKKLALIRNILADCFDVLVYQVPV